MRTWYGMRKQRRRGPTVRRPTSAEGRGNGECQEPSLLVTWESESRAIAGETTSWSTETGGDLFGLVTPMPVVLLATRVGPNAVRETAHFKLDIEYLRSLSDLLAGDWGLRYLGDWHSHHRLGLPAPSAGDRERIRRVASRNGFPVMAEVIATIERGRVRSPAVELHPWTYMDRQALPRSADLLVLPGCSPVREALYARGHLPEQELGRWTQAPSPRTPSGDAPPGLEAAVASTMAAMASCLLAHARRVLQDEAGNDVEEHGGGFGTILAAPVDSTCLVGIAVGREWPCQILEVHWIDRSRRRSDALELPSPPNLLVPEEVVALYRRVCSLKAGGGEADVDSTSA